MTLCEARKKDGELCTKGISYTIWNSDPSIELEVCGVHKNVWMRLGWESRPLFCNIRSHL